MSQKSEALQFSMKFDKDKMWLFHCYQMFQLISKTEKFPFFYNPQLDDPKTEHLYNSIKQCFNWTLLLIDIQRQNVLIGYSILL